MKLIDLHVHSTCSDGTLSPSELALYAKSKGLTAIALTDHDTISGIEECMNKGAQIGITIIPGIEFSADFHGTELHILGYAIDYKNEAFKKYLEMLIAERAVRNQKMLDKLNALGLSLTLEDLAEGYPNETVFTRAHFASALLRKGYISDRNDAFRKYIGAGKPAYVPRHRVSAYECIESIHTAGGIAVLAHPKLYGYSNQEVTQVIKDLKSHGLDGVECLYSTHTQDETQHLIQVCEQHHLIPTGGSDFHGDNKPRLDIGSGYGNLKVPYTILKALLSKADCI